MKRANHHLARRLGSFAPQIGNQQRLGPLAHLSRRLIGKRDRRNPLRRHAALNQPRNLVRDHPRLARARACEHEARTMEEIHGLLLGDIQSGAG